MTQDPKLLDTDITRQIVELTAKVLEYLSLAMWHKHKKVVYRYLSNVAKRVDWGAILEDIKGTDHEIINSMGIPVLAGVGDMHDTLIQDIKNREQQREQDRKDKEAEARTQKLDRVIRWLSGKGASNDYKTLVPSRHKGTCQWLTQHARFLQWFNRWDVSTRVLWVSAYAGCGKSVLAKYLVDEILPGSHSTQKPSDRTVCHFFFKDRERKKQKFKDALRSLTWQLLTKNRHLVDDALLNDLNDQGENVVKSMDVLWEAFTKIAKKKTEVICVLDAMDECIEKDREDLVKKITALELGNVKFLITSRPNMNIQHGLDDILIQFSSSHIQGENKEQINIISKEISLVIDEKVASLVKVPQTERDFLKKQLNEHANLTYLWVDLVFDYIERTLKVTKRTSGPIRRVFQNKPDNLDDAYTKILERSSDPAEAQKLLQVVLAARRPLSLAEIEVVLSIKEEHRSFKTLEAELSPTNEIKIYIENLCGLVRINDEHVYLLHQTTQEYLLSPHVSKTATNSTRLKLTRPLSLVQSHRVLAAACMHYIALDDLKSCSPVFNEYSGIYWASHFRQGQIKKDEPLAKSALKLCLTTSNLWSILRPMYLRWFGRNSLLLAVDLGLVEIVQLLVTKGSDIKVRNPQGRAAMHFAVANEDIDMMRLVKDLGAEIDPIDNDGKSALSQMMFSHDLPVLEFKLKGGANPNVRGEDGRTPLHTACYHGNESITKLLLQHGADPNLGSRGSGSTMPIFWALLHNSAPMIKALLECKAEVDLKNKSGQSPWDLAMRSPNREIRILFERYKQHQSLDFQYSETKAERYKNDLKDVFKIMQERGDLSPSLGKMVFHTNS